MGLSKDYLQPGKKYQSADEDVAKALRVTAGYALRSGGEDPVGLCRELIEMIAPRQLPKRIRG